MTDKPDLLMPVPMLEPTMASIDKAFTVHRLWQASDPDAMVAAVADSCRFVAVGGHGRSTRL